jgi:hypothetical protein
MLRLLTPSPASSPRVLWYPHPGFSRASRRTRALMFRRVAGRPVLACMDLAAQRRRTMSRCQRRIVSGVTSSSRSLWRRVLGITASRVAASARSAQFSFGRRGWRRCSMASWWRRIKISAVFHASSCWDSRSHAATRAARRNMNRRHIIVDLHGGRPGEQLCWSRPRTGLSARTTAGVTPGCPGRSTGAGRHGRPRYAGIRRPVVESRKFCIEAGIGGLSLARARRGRMRAGSLAELPARGPC